MKLILIIVCGLLTMSIFARPTESNLLAQLQSGDWQQMKEAMHKLPTQYPHSTNAVAIIRDILHRNQTLVVFEEVVNYDTDQRTGTHATIRRPVHPDAIARESARALGNYHITPTETELDIIFNQLIAPHNSNAAMDGLKALRGMDATNAVPRLLPLLQDGNVHVVRDTMRTLAVLGDASVIPYIEPFLHNQNVHNHNNQYIAGDAQAAIKALKLKSERGTKSGNTISE